MRASNLLKVSYTGFVQTEKIGMEDIRILDEVALLIDKPTDKLRRGDVGTVVEVSWSEQRQSREYTVEFIDEKGRLLASLYITDPTEIVALHVKPQPPTLLSRLTGFPWKRR
jgi:hypothetical protein